MVHFASNHNAFLSEGGAHAVVVRDFPETPNQTRDNTDFPRPLRQGEARLRLACPWREGHRAGQQVGAGGQQTTARPLATTGTWRTGASTPDVRRVERHGCWLVEGFVPSRSVAIALWTHPFVTVRSNRGVHPSSGGVVASRTDGAPVIAGTSNLVRVQAITA